MKFKIKFIYKGTEVELEIDMIAILTAFATAAVMFAKWYFGL